MIRVYLTEWKDGDPKNSKAVGHVNVACTKKHQASSGTPSVETYEAEFFKAGVFIGRVAFDIKACSAESQFKVVTKALDVARKEGLFE